MLNPGSPEAEFVIAIMVAGIVRFNQHATFLFLVPAHRKGMVVGEIGCFIFLQEMARGRGTSSHAARNAAAASALENPALLSLLPPAAKAQVADYRARFGGSRSHLVQRALAAHPHAHVPPQQLAGAGAGPAGAAASISATAPAAHLTSSERAIAASRRKL